jgi:predicted RNA-binding Zn ribbon-like protein
MRIEAFDFSTLDLFHERLCLDFANTTPFHHNLSEDHLNTYADLLSWSNHVNLLDEEQAQTLLTLAASQPAEADAVLQKAHRLRADIFAIFYASAYNATPDSDALDSLNAALSASMAYMQLKPVQNAYEWAWTGDANDLEQMLWPVAWSAGELLMSDDLKLLRHCDGHECDWLFLDTSRNHSRRWCDMKTCGNRAKAKRHYQRNQSEG